MLQEIDRITAAMNASEFTYELLCIDDASHRRHPRGALRRGPPLRQHPGDAVPAQRRLRHGPAHRHPAGPRRDRRLDRRRHDLRERADPRARPHPARRRQLRPGRRRADHRGGHPQVGPGAGQVGHPQDRRAPVEPEDPRPQLGAARVPPHGGAALPAAAAVRLLLRHHDHAGVPAEPARHQVRADRATPSGPARASSTSSRTPTATSCRCCGWSCTSTRSRC